MTKDLYTDDLTDHENLGSYDTATFTLASASKKGMVFIDDSGAGMILHGEHITMKKGAITGGTITSAEFYNASDEKIYTFKDVDASALGIYKAYSVEHNPARVMHGLMGGNDTVTGSKMDDSLWGFYGDDVLNGKLGDDMLFGHQGNDTLTGGRGADSFALTYGSDHDTVTDFDVKGKDHDFVYMDYYLYDGMTITRDGKDLVLTLETGDQMVLENVKKADLTIDHFDFF
jgi:hypothetical protein